MLLPNLSHYISSSLRLKLLNRVSLLSSSTSLWINFPWLPTDLSVKLKLLNRASSSFFICCHNYASLSEFELLSVLSTWMTLLPASLPNLYAIPLHQAHFYSSSRSRFRCNLFHEVWFFPWLSRLDEGYGLWFHSYSSFPYISTLYHNEL